MLNVVWKFDTSGTLTLQLMETNFESQHIKQKKLFPQSED